MKKVFQSMRMTNTNALMLVYSGVAGMCERESKRLAVVQLSTAYQTNMREFILYDMILSMVIAQVYLKEHSRSYKQNLLRVQEVE